MNCSTYRKTGLIRNVQASGIDAEFLCFAGTSNSALTHACASFSIVSSNIYNQIEVSIKTRQQQQERRRQQQAWI